MYRIIVLSIFSCIFYSSFHQISCKPVEEPTDTIVSFNYDTPNEHEYRFTYRTSNGTTRTEIGTLYKEAGELKLRVEGNYQYTKPDGKRHSVFYSSGENGFKAMVNQRRPAGVYRIGGKVLDTLTGGGLG